MARFLINVILACSRKLLTKLFFLFIFIVIIAFEQNFGGVDIEKVIPAVAPFE